MPHPAPRLRPLLLAVLLPAAAAAQDTPFRDVSEDAGVLFKHSDSAFSYAMGGGVAWFDADGDGDEDLLVTSSTGRHKIFRREPDGFVDATEGSNLDNGLLTDNIGVIVADYDQDGLRDVYLTNNGANQLFRNLGGFVFEDVAPALGVAGEWWSTSASFADFDRDGDLDLYVGNYVGALNFPYHFGEPNQLYVNVGTSAAPIFQDRAAQLGVADTGVFGPSVPGFPYVSPEGQATAGCTLSVHTLDYDEDGDADLMVGNDFGLWVLPDRLYRNDTPPGGPLVFTDVNDATGFGQGLEYNMGVHGADYDHDGDWDVYLTNLGDNLLLQAEGGAFTDVAPAAGPLDGHNDAGTLLLTSWGTVWADFDNDGWEDLLVVNGYIPAATFIANEFRAENHLWRNLGDGTFERLEPELSGMNDPGAGRGVASADFDADGFVDFYVMNNGAPGVGLDEDRCRLFSNEGTMTVDAAGHHWVELALQGRFSNWEALGARVEARLDGDVQKRQVLGDPVFVSSSSRVVHFGLGTRQVVDELTFHWPSGRTSRWIEVPGDLVYDVLEPLVLAQGLAAAGGSSTLTVGLSVQNDAADPVPASLFVFVEQAQTGKPVVSGVVDVSVPAGASTPSVSLSIAPALAARLEGEPLAVRAYVLAAGALDSYAATLPVF